MIDWANIKVKIFNNVSKTLKSGSPAYSDSEITEAIELFKNFVIIKSGYQFLDGLPKLLLPSLQEALIEKKGEPSTLANISTNIEPFIRKILVLVGKQNYTDVEKKGLAPLLKKTNINTALTAQVKSEDYPRLDDNNSDTYKGEPEYLYSICKSYVTRNTVHTASDLDDAEVLFALKHLLIVYIYVILKFSNEIKQLPSISSSNVKKESDAYDNEQKMLFDFINFGNTSTEIKTQIVNAYILHSLTNKEFVEIDIIEKDSNNYFENAFSSQFYIRKIDHLIQKGKIEYIDKEKKKIRLTASESEILSKGQTNFNENKDLFYFFYDELLKKYNIENKKDELLKKLEEFFENNFNIDICEIYCKIVDNYNENAIYSSLMDYLKTITGTDQISEDLFKDILLLCENNDFIIRICASKVFSKISNPDQFQNYLRLQKRSVYLDSQIILYALCYNYLPKDNYDNIFYKITANLLTYVNSNPNIELKFANQYLTEIAYQLKLALLLIPFADNGITSDISLSTNIYYQFYYFLKNNNLLDSETESFEDFLKNWMLLEEEDAYDSDYEKIASNSVITILKENLNIEVVKLPYYEDWNTASNVLEEAIKENLLSIKSPYVLKNDAIMVCHLSNSQEHTNEPFFLTWDKSFTPFRKKFKEKFRRQDLISWHLFNPAKFLNHMDLINFKIDPSSITNDFLSIIDGLGIHRMTRSIYDSMNRFLDIKNINKQQRHKYIKITKEIFSESEFSYNVDTPVEELKIKISDSFAEILDNLNNYLYNESKLGIDRYRKMLLDENYFVKIAELIRSHIKMKIVENQIDQKSLFLEIDQNIKDYQEKEIQKISDKL